MPDIHTERDLFSIIILEGLQYYISSYSGISQKKVKEKKTNKNQTKNPHRTRKKTNKQKITNKKINNQLPSVCSSDGFLCVIL